LIKEALPHDAGNGNATMLSSLAALVVELLLTTTYQKDKWW